MNAKDAIRTALTSTQHLAGWFVSDLSDADLLVRPVPGANHIAWQLGHLAVADQRLIRSQFPDADYPELPAGFAELHRREGAARDGPDGFRTKAEYLDLFNRMRAATLAVLDRVTEADLDQPVTGNMAKFAPTLGALFLLVSNHTLLHTGQFSVVRRKLGKPVLF
jgi:hypothetical protein